MRFPDIPGYQIQEEIGAGVMGAVYRARHLAQDRSVALKVLHPKFARDPGAAAKLLQEAQAAAGVSHPNLAAVHDCGRTEGAEALIYLAEQFVHGRPLTEVLAIRQPPPLECAQIVTQIADALDHAHQRGVVHGNIHPGNIMLCPDGKALLTGLGWPAAGSPAYLSAEQCKGMKATPRSDQYSLAVTLYEMLAGKPPFVARDADAVRHQQASHAPPALPAGRTDITPRMEAAVMRALAKAPELRFAMASDFAREFEAACLERPAAGVVVGAAPGRDPHEPSVNPVSLVGGNSFASPSRGAYSSVYVSAVHGAAATRRRRSLAVVMLLLILCGGVGVAAYLSYFRTTPPAVAATARPGKAAKKSPKGRNARGATRRAGRSGSVSPVSIPGERTSDKEKEPSSTEEPSADAEHSTEGDNPAPDKPEESKDKGEGKSDNGSKDESKDEALEES